jgi:carbamoyltransferase
MDGVGEWATTSVWLGEGNRLTPQWEIRSRTRWACSTRPSPTFTGFKVNSGEYKLMGLAPYGEPRYQDLILEHLLALKDDGSFRMDMRYFNYANGLTMTSKAFDRLFGGPPRKPESPVTQREMDLAASIQAVTEEVVLRLGAHRASGTGRRPALPGRRRGAELRRQRPAAARGPVHDIWVQPAAGDAGGALGAALSVWHEYLERPRRMHGAERPHARLLSRPRIRQRRRSRPIWTRARHPLPAPRRRRADAGARRDCWTTGRWSAGSRAAWSSARARWAGAPSSATRAARRCSR